MDAVAYQSLRELQGQHWWFVARRQIIDHLIRNFVKLPEKSRILEAGCGYGGNLALLRQFGELDAFEFEDSARAFATTLSNRPVAHGYLPDKAGFDGEHFDLIAMLDVLEHIEQDTASLQALHERLKVGGSILLTVPAVPWLWSKHDEIHHHKRRYSKASLEKALTDAGFAIDSIGYFNSLLFPVAVAQRMAQRIARSEAGVDSMPGRVLNNALRAVFAFERKLIGRFKFPIGLSLYAVARRIEA
jgi:SAM-dependent methyltransferase